MPDQRERVSQLYAEALSRQGTDRADFLRHACGGDESLRVEVESLLAHASAPLSIIDVPLAAWAAGALRDSGGSLIGRSVGGYQILSTLGAGGMGEVYRAHDLTLGRDVAIKILPESVTSDPERQARFKREARMLASLNHPHIGAIYGVEESDGVRALVLELVEGLTLAERLAKGSIPLTESLAIARQIAEALEAAHEKGIIHRDLKPANVKMTPAGVVKVLDFGLAKLDTRDGSAPDLIQSPTVTVGGTREGIVLGTAAYMSPEQARGQAVDKRTDIWAFGCVLYEMLTGRAAFAHETVSDTIAAILERELEWAALPAATPVSIRRLLRRCLEKDPRRRLRDIGDAQFELDSASAGADRSPVAPGIGRTRHTWSLAGAIATLVVIGVAVDLVVRRGSDEHSTQVTRVLVDAAPAEQLGTDPFKNEGRPDRTAMTLSADGRSLVFSAVRGGLQQLYVRDLDQPEARPIAGTVRGTNPFFSADGNWVGFWAGGALRKVALRGGGPAVTICEVSGEIFGASWGSNDTIVFAERTGGLWGVSAAGGAARPLTTLDAKQGEIGHRLPQILPGNQAVLFTVTRGMFPKWDETQVAVQSLGTGSRKILIEGGADARYVSTGHLVYARAGTLMGVPFDLKRLTVTGGPVGLVSDLMQATNWSDYSLDSGAGQFSVSASGSLVYLTGGMPPELERTLVWVDRTGAEHPLAMPTRAYTTARLSPDGQRVAVTIVGPDTNVWIQDLLRGTLTRLTVDGTSVGGLWTPDGKHIAFMSLVNGRDNLFWKAADGSGIAERLDTSENARTPSSWTSDGQTLAFIESHPTTLFDIWVLPLAGDRRPHPILHTKAQESHPEFSPDGRWLAYVSNESGRYEVFVQPYPGPGARQQVSTEGGLEPAWSRDGRELFYTAPQSPTRPFGQVPQPGIRMMAVQLTTNPASLPRVLFEGRYYFSFGIRSYDVTADGRRFLMIQEKERPPAKPTHMILVQNWTEELKRLVPTR